MLAPTKSCWPNNESFKCYISKKSHRRRLKEEEGTVNNPIQGTAGSDVDAKVVKKVILKKSTTAGPTTQSNIDPSVTQTIATSRKKSPSPKGSREKRGLNCIVSGEVQPAPKRQRLD